MSQDPQDPPDPLEAILLAPFGAGQLRASWFGEKVVVRQALYVRCMVY
jgi:hypothetical protein